MILSIDLVESRSVSKYKSENKFKFGVKIVVEFVFKVVIKSSCCLSCSE